MKKSVLIILLWSVCFVSSGRLWGQNGAHCGCPPRIELRQYNYWDCAMPLSFILYWDAAQPSVPAYLLQNVEVALQNVGTTAPCPGVISFPYGCPDRHISFVDKPACYTNAGNTSPSGSLRFQNGLTCLYTNGTLSGHAPAVCPVSCGDVIYNCLPSLSAYARDYLSIADGCKQWNGPCNTASLIYRMGAVSIGTESHENGHLLNVKGGILTEQIKICATEWCDYVFEEGYCLRSLPETEAFIREYGHLPGCTSGRVIEAEAGFQVENVLTQQQEKIEEIFLHLIALQKQLDSSK